MAEELEKESDVKAVDQFVERYQHLEKEIGKTILGQEDVVRNVLISIFSKGHCLLVGVPGLAKTLLVDTIARTLDLDFNRIQFTPDLMPSDIIGAEILDENRQFRFVKGPLFANIILADEINRTPPKTQSALLEAMQEKAVSAAGKTMKLEEPFFVLATQNPIEQEGTYPLPEAQLDRFMFNIWMEYPTYEEELNVLRTTTTDATTKVEPVISSEDILFFQGLIRRLPVPDNVYGYCVQLASRTRPGTSYATERVNEFLSWGAGPRASQFLVIGAKCHAAINGKYSPDIEDVQAVALPILRHRVIRNYKAAAESLGVDDILKELI